MNANTISVLITYHNEGALLQDCLQSLIAQTDHPEEVLIFDDASSDRPEVYLPAGLAVRVVRSDVNVGPSVGRNRLLAESNSEFVHFQDADDWFMPTWCQKVRAAFNQNAVDVVLTDANTYRDGLLETPYILGLSRLNDERDLLRFCLENPVLVPAGTYRKSLVQSIGGYATDVWQSEDYDFHARLAIPRPPFFLVLEPLIAVRRRRDGRSERQHEVWQSTLQVIQKLASKVDGAHREILVEAAGTAAIALYRLGLRIEASSALAWARRMGTPHFGREWFFYRWIARMFGPFFAEHVSASYRRCFPPSLRQNIRWLGEKCGFGARRATYF